MTSREPLQIVEIDIDRCSLTYGTSPCTASGGAGSECFNLFKHCQDTANFDRETYTLSFSKNQRTGIFGQVIYPALQSVSTNPTRIALSRVDDKLGSLGKRARVSVTLKDFRWTDVGTDPYVTTRSYDPATQGTFFGRLRARFPYYYGRALRVRNGYVGDTISAMPTRHYIITEWKGPDANGTVTLTAQDPLKLADEEFAQCPAPSNGKLAADIAVDYLGTVDLIPASVGSEYAASGRIAIGSEIMTFTRSGDTLTITGRGLDGSEAAAHSADDTVQECYRVEAQTIDTVAADLLENFAGLDASFLPTSDWAAEIGDWMLSIRCTRTIPKPQPVRKLLGQLADFGVVFWWDEIEQEVKLRANRPPGFTETFSEFSDDDTFIEKTIAREDLDEQRYSSFIYVHGQIDATGSDEDTSNFKKASAPLPQGDGANEYDQSRILTIFQPWLGNDGDDQTADVITERLIARYRDTPQRFTFHADAKDIDELTPAALVKLTSRLMQDEFGASLATEMQVTSVEEIQPGVKVKVMAESYKFEGRFFFWMPNDASASYATATEAEKAKGFYWAPDEDGFADGTPPFLWF